MTTVARCPKCNLELTTTLRTKKATRVRARNWMVLHILKCDGVSYSRSFMWRRCPVCKDKQCNHTDHTDSREGIPVWTTTAKCPNCRVKWKMEFLVG